MEFRIFYQKKKKIKWQFVDKTYLFHSCIPPPFTLASTPLADPLPLFSSLCDRIRTVVFNSPTRWTRLNNL